MTNWNLTDTGIVRAETPLSDETKAEIYARVMKRFEPKPIVVNLCRACNQHEAVTPNGHCQTCLNGRRQKFEQKQTKEFRGSFVITLIVFALMIAFVFTFCSNDNHKLTPKMANRK